MFDVNTVLPLAVRVGKIAGLVMTGYAAARAVDTVRAYREHKKAVTAVRASQAYQEFMKQVNDVVAETKAASASAGGA